MRAVNLLPRDVERTRSGSGRAPVFVLAGGLAAVTLATAVLVLSTSGTVSDHRADLDLVESEIAAATKSEQPAVAQNVVVQERADRVAALAAGLSTRVPMDQLLRQLAYVLPEDAWLTGLSATSPEEEAPAGSSPGGGSPGQHAAATPGVTIQGVTYSHESVARVLSRLAVLPSLDDVRLTASARVQPQGAKLQPGAVARKKPKSVVTFTITASFSRGGRR